MASSNDNSSTSTTIVTIIHSVASAVSNPYSEDVVELESLLTGKEEEEEHRMHGSFGGLPASASSIMAILRSLKTAVEKDEDDEADEDDDSIEEVDLEHDGDMFESYPVCVVSQEVHADDFELDPCRNTGSKLEEKGREDARDKYDALDESYETDMPNHENDERVGGR